MPRELWKGAIQFGLVHIPVSLFPAEQREELSFTMLDRRDLQPVGYKRFNKTTGDEVPSEQIVKGYEWTEGEYVTLEKEDFKRANVEATQTVDIFGFVEKEQLPSFFFESPYYLAPGKHGDKGYALLRETLVRTGRVGLATVVIRTREHLAALYAVDNVLVLNTLRYANELRDPKELKLPEDLKSAKVTAKEVDMAKAEPKAKRATRGAEVIDFAALLEKSLGGQKREPGVKKAANDEHHGARKAPAARTRRKTPKAATQRKAA